MNLFIVTLMIARTLAEIFSGGKIIWGLPSVFSKAISGKVGPIPVLVLIAASVDIIAHFILSNTRFGANVYTIGANFRAAFACGIPVKRYTLSLYVISGFLSGIAGLLLTGQMGATNPTVANGYELDAIAATIIGGTSFSGGEGSIESAKVLDLIKE